MPFEIPESWCWCKLSDVCNFESGYAFSSDDYKDKGIPLVRISNIQDGLVSLDNCVYIEGDIDKRFIINSGDLLIAMSGATTGKMGVYQYDCPALLNQRVGNIKVNTSLLLQKYRDYFMQSQGDLILKLSYGGAQPNVSAKIISDLFIPIPSLSEQEKIVVEIEKWFSFIDEIENGKLELESYIKQAKSKILDLAISGKLVPQDSDDEPAIELLRKINPAFKPCDNSHYENLPQGWTVCRLEDVLDYEQPQAYIVDSTDYSDEYETPVLTAGKSFIIGYTNETIGICNRLPVIIFDDFTTDSKLVDFPFKIKSSAMKILRTKGEINIEYVAYFMSITRLIGDTHKRYWISEYSKLPIPIPPYQEQLRIVETIETILNEILKITAEL